MKMERSESKETEIGKIPKGWELRKICELDSSADTVRTGPFGSLLHASDYADDGVPLLLVRNFEDGKITDFDIPKVNWEKAKELERFRLRKGDIVFSRVGVVGRTLYVTDKEEGWLFSGQTLRIRIKNHLINNQFVEYFFRSPRAKKVSEQTALGTTRPSINTTILANRKIPIPPIEEQNKIVNILKKLDEKIDLNTQMNRTLEAISQALFRHWFIDFEFPSKNEKPYRSSGGEMVFNDEYKREIPKGWETKPFSEVIAVNPRRRLGKGTLAKKVGMKNLDPWVSWIESWEVERYESGSRFINGDILFARITPSLEHGKTALVMFLDKNEIAFGTTEFIVLSPDVIGSSYFIFHLVRDDLVRETVISAMTGTSGRQRVPSDFFDNFMITVPPSCLVRRFDDIIRPLYKRIQINIREKKIITHIRDLILPRLTSGEMRISTEKGEMRS